MFYKFFTLYFILSAVLSPHLISSQQGEPPVSEACQKALKEPSACLSGILKQWKVTEAQLDGTGDGIADQPFCCGTWGMQDCSTALVKVYFENLI